MEAESKDSAKMNLRFGFGRSKVAEAEASVHP